MEKIAIAPDGTKTIYRLAQDQTGNQYWSKVNDVVGGVNSAYNTVAKNLAKTSDNILQDRRSLGQRTRADLANSLSLFDEAMVDAGQQTTGLLTGLKSGALKTAGVIADVWGKEHPWLVNENTGIDLYKKAMAIDSTRANEQKLMEEFNQEKGVPAAIGGSLPYILTGSLIGPTVNKVVGKTLEDVTDVAKQVGNESKSLLAKGSRAAATSELPPVKWAGNKAVKEYVEPLENWSNAIKQRSPMASPYRTGTLKDVLGGTVLGGLEGAVNSDLDTASGAEAGLFGAVAGRALKPYIENAKLPNDPSYNEALKRIEGKGYVPLPGEVLDSPKLQSEEHAMRSHDKYSALLKEHDAANQRVINREAYSAMGANAEHMTPADISAHIDVVKDKYQQLERQTAARIEQSDIASLKQHAKTLEGSTTDEGIKASKYAKDYLKKFDKFRAQQTVTRNSVTGRMQGATQPGAPWQQLRSEIKEDITNLSNKGEWRAASALQPFLNTLDAAVESGLTKLGKTPEEGAAIVANWKDLNEQYAMGKLLMHKGMDAFGNVDPTRLNSHFMRTDPERYLQNKGGRITKLFDVARTAPIEKRQAGSSLSGLNMSEVGVEPKRTERQVFLSTPASLVPGPLSEAYFRAYRQGYPQVTGLIPFMSGEGLKNTGLYTRAMAQSSQIHPTIINAVSSGVNNTMDFVQHPIQTVQDMLSNIMSSKRAENQK